MTVPLLVARQVWPMLALLTALLAGAFTWFVLTNDRALLSAAWAFFSFCTFGAVGSFAVHEWGHAASLARCHGITSCDVERTMWRFSLAPRGTITGWGAVGVAAGGPALGAMVGCLLWLAGAPAYVWWWHVAQLAFLAPTFGDGRAALRGLAAGSRTLSW